MAPQERLHPGPHAVSSAPSPHHRDFPPVRRVLQLVYWFLIVIYLVPSVLSQRRGVFFLPPPEAFKINKDSGLVTSRRRLQSYERFNLTVVATDKGHPPLWGTTMLHVEVIDINDNRPVFIRPPNGTILHIKEVKTLEREWGSCHAKTLPWSAPAFQWQNPISISTGDETRP